MGLEGAKTRNWIDKLFKALIDLKYFIKYKRINFFVRVFRKLFEVNF
jgi:hypothetical protein